MDGTRRKKVAEYVLEALTISATKSKYVGPPRHGMSSEAKRRYPSTTRISRALPHLQSNGNSTLDQSPHLNNVMMYCLRRAALSDIGSGGDSASRFH